MDKYLKDLKVKLVATKSIKPHPKNARIHDEANINAIIESIKEFGQRTPVVVGKNRFILKGCGTWEAIARMKRGKIAIVEALHLTKEQELAYALADNKTSDMSEFDYAMVTETLNQLNAGGYDLQKTGFRDFEQKPLLAADWKPEVEEDDEMVEHPDESKILFKFEGDQYKLVLVALDLFRKVNAEDQDVVSQRDPEILLYILDEYIRKNTVTKISRKRVRRKK